MAAKAAIMDDHVVDMVLEVDSRGIDVEDLTRAFQLPGRVLLRSCSSGRIWLTVVVSASDEGDAIARVRDQVLAHLPVGIQATLEMQVDCCALGALYAGLDHDLSDEELDRIDLLTLVEQRFWHDPAGSSRVLNLRGGLLSNSA